MAFLEGVNDGRWQMKMTWGKGKKREVKGKEIIARIQRRDEKRLIMNRDDSQIERRGNGT